MWRSGPTQAERLAAALLRLEGYSDVGPQAPLGGPDGRADILCSRGGYTRRLRTYRTRNAFSKTLENHALSIALHYMHYNFVRIHKTLRTTPAMAAGVSDELWEISDIVNLVEISEAT